MQLVRNLTQIEQINFLLTNRVPRHLLTRFMGWYSRIESPLLARFSIFVWKMFADDIDLHEAKEQSFNSLHDCFIRELKEGARTIDRREHVIASPCDAIVGAHGAIDGLTVFQAKGFPYDISDLVPDRALQEKYRNGRYITLRLKSSMYHHFHAPVDGEVKQVNYISGDCWNVNPVALKRVEKLYCKNERAFLELKTDRVEHDLLLIPVAAILVASMKFECLESELNLQYTGRNKIPCDARYARGDDMGYFQHGSTIIMLCSSEYDFIPGIETGVGVRMGQALMQRDEDKPNG